MRELYRLASKFGSDMWPWTNYIPSLGLTFHLQDGHNKSFLSIKGVDTYFLPYHSNTPYIVY